MQSYLEVFLISFVLMSIGAANLFLLMLRKKYYAGGQNAPTFQECSKLKPVSAGKDDINCGVDESNNDDSNAQ